MAIRVPEARIPTTSLRTGLGMTELTISVSIKALSLRAVGGGVPDAPHWRGNPYPAVVAHTGAALRRQMKDMP